MKTRTCPLLGMVEEKVFIVDMRESTARDIWMGPDWTGPREKREGKSGGGREKEERESRSREEPRSKSHPRRTHD